MWYFEFQGARFLWIFSNFHIRFPKAGQTLSQCDRHQFACTFRRFLFVSKLALKHPVIITLKQKSTEQQQHADPWFRNSDNSRTFSFRNCLLLVQKAKDPLDWSTNFSAFLMCPKSFSMWRIASLLIFSFKVIQWDVHLHPSASSLVQRCLPFSTSSVYEFMMFIISLATCYTIYLWLWSLVEGVFEAHRPLPSHTSEHTILNNDLFPTFSGSERLFWLEAGPIACLFGLPLYFRSHLLRYFATTSSSVRFEGLEAIRPEISEYRQSKHALEMLKMVPKGAKRCRHA